ncbi:class I SAM-dependent methyltransferase [Persephonella sp.]
MTCRCKSRFNAVFMKNLEWYMKNIYGKFKIELFNRLGNTVLEIGAGTGINLGYYRKGTDLTVVEPSKDMIGFLKEKARKSDIKLHIIEGVGEKLPFDDNSFDSVVTTLVLCSVQSQTKVLREIKRVLKPEGRFIFIEHVVAPEHTLTYSVQNVLQPIWKWLFEGCDIKRDTASAIRKFFPDAYIKNVRFNSPFIPVNYHIVGYGIKKDHSA